MLVVGIIAAALLLLVVFAWLVPPDRGEESALWLIPFYGAFFGALTAAAAGVLYGLALIIWTRRSGRSVRSRAWIGAVGAGIGAFAFWLLYGYVLSGTHGVPVWSGVGGGAGVVAMLVAGPLTARAARRAADPS